MKLRCYQVKKALDLFEVFKSGEDVCLMIKDKRIEDVLLDVLHDAGFLCLPHRIPSNLIYTIEERK